MHRLLCPYVVGCFSVPLRTNAAIPPSDRIPPEGALAKGGQPIEPADRRENADARQQRVWETKLKPKRLEGSFPGEE